MTLGVRAARALLGAGLVVVGVAWACAAVPPVPRVSHTYGEQSARHALLADGKDGTQAVCPKVEPSHVEGRVASNDIDELSGLTASRRQAGVFWVHNDSGDEARLFATARRVHPWVRRPARREGENEDEDESRVTRTTTIPRTWTRCALPFALTNPEHEAARHCCRERCQFDELQSASNARPRDRSRPRPS